MRNMMQSTNGNFSASLETFFELLKKFKMSGKRSYDFLTKAGKKFQLVIFKFCQNMFSEEKFPKEFQETILNMIFKGGNKRKEVLSNNRFIHCKYWFPRVAEG